MYKVSDSLIGMIHFPPLLLKKGFPGIEYIQDKVVKEAEILEKAGFDAIMVENNYDFPHTEFLQVEQAMIMSQLTNLICDCTNIPIGISALWNDFKVGISICKTTRANFVRIPVFVDSVKTSYGVIKAKPAEILSYRKELEATDTALFVDVHVKHAEMIDKNKELVESCRESKDKGADGLIITGKWTGNSPINEDLVKAKEAAPSLPILIGSGIDHENIKKYKPICDGIIVGTSIKEGNSFNKEKEINLKPYEYTISEEKAKKLVGIYKE